MMGSAHIFHDKYIDKEENNKLQEVVFRWLTSDDITLNTIDGEDPEVINTAVIRLISGNIQAKHGQGFTF